MEFRTDIIVANAGAIAEGVLITLLVTSFSFLVALVLGAVVGILRRRRGVLSRLLGGYVSFFRGTPLLIQLFLIYYGLPSIGLSMPRYVAAVLSLALNSAAYISEILRGALGAVPKGQEEAAQVLGLTRMETLVFIVFPQALRVALPALVNSFSSILKDSSLVSVLSIIELTRIGQLIYTRTYRAFEIYLTVALIYYVLTETVACFSRRIERALEI
ncbi:MAG: amino acid ABC transporter permease [Fretibacterium sp.]|nr:amino acid ABC transporter permease [Fretibacterium sp.]